MPKQTAIPSYEEIDATITNDCQFYQTPREMALKAISARLTAAEWSLWTYLQLLDPYGDRIKELPPVSDLAKAVGVSERQIHRALNRLKDLELYYWEPVIIRGQNLAGKRAKEVCRDKSKKSSGDDKLTTSSSQRQSCRDDDKVVFMESKLSPPGQSHLQQPPKPPSANGSSSPQTYSDYSNFIHTLSEDEREIFLEFGRKKAANLPHPPELPDKWVIAHFTELYKQFLASSAGQEAKRAVIASTDWTQHSDWAEWLAMMREGVPRFVALGTCFDNKTRRAIADWADSRGLIWGTES